MDLAYTDKQKPFAPKCAWLAANCAARTLQSFDTAEGFKQHRVGVSGPTAANGDHLPEAPSAARLRFDRMADFEEEYWRAGALLLRVNQNGGIFPGFPLDPDGVRVRRRKKVGILPKMANGTGGAQVLI